MIFINKEEKKCKSVEDFTYWIENTVDGGQIRGREVVTNQIDPLAIMSSYKRDIRHDKEDIVGHFWCVGLGRRNQDHGWRSTITHSIN
jgi:hypothetical protein